MTIRAIHNHIIIKFVDPVNARGEFEEATHKSGIIMKGGYDKSAKSPRWATALSVGPECEHIKEGDKLLIPALRWTEGVKYQEERYWKTDESQLVGYERDGKVTFINEYVIFSTRKEVISQSAGGLFVVSHTPDETPSGNVIDVSSECEPALVGGAIYYDDANFFNFFELDGKEVAFIKEEDILAYTPTEG